ncbi:MAG: hypothetical protein KAT90_03685 [Gammaproteobacteria bacterium]|nr:hypothetical protein [Gammaproteobacteria bacterium]
MKDFGWDSFLIRFIFATVIVFSTYNPEGYSYFHWATESFSIFNVYKAFTGVILFIGWAILIRASLGSLGVFGLSLASVFFGLLIWLIIDVLGLTANSMRSISYIVEIMIANVLSIGVSWSHIRRRVSGQVDTDELDRER